MLNKRGYVMIYAIGVIALLMLLAASLTSLTMTRTNWTNLQSRNIKEMNHAKAQVEAAASDLATYFDGYDNNDYKYLYELDTEFQAVFQDVETRYGVIVRNLTIDSCVYPTDPDADPCYPLNPNLEQHEYTYAYDIVYASNNYVAQKRFFLSMIPSFLYFALGSKTDMTLNGGAYIDGDMYVNHDLYLSDSTNYKINDSLYNQQTTFPTVNANSSIYLKNMMYACSNLDHPCYDLSSNEFIKSNFDTVTNISQTFVDTPPKIKQYNDRFLNVNFDASYIYYLKKAIGTTDDLNLTDLENEFNTYIAQNKLYVANSWSDVNNQDTKSIYIKNPDTLKESLNFTKDQWIIVDGDLKIENYDNTNTITINANLLVTGNITISGYVQFNSTTYALGEGVIHNANINYNDNNNNELVLLTKQDLQFSRINEFDNSFNGVNIDQFTGDITIKPNIKGFFYTDSYVNIFTVSSYLVIEGGVYSNDASNLTIDANNHYIIKDPPYTNITQTDSIGMIINSYRGSVNPITNSNLFSFTFSDYFKRARFVVKYSPDVIITQPKGLPLNKEINYLFENVTVKKMK